MFTSNNIQAGEKLSLEVLCSEIVIYVPINQKFADMIKADPLTSKVFRDSHDNIVFGYKAHIGVDKVTGIVHGIVVTPANVHDVVEHNGRTDRH